MPEAHSRHRDGQHHKIMRQVLELEGCTEDNAQQLQSVLRDSYYRQLLPLIDKVCSEVSHSGSLHRIQRLEIDLGELPIETLGALDPGSLESFEEAFYRQLTAHIDESDVGDTDLELFGYFLRTGTTPWWVQPFSQNELDDSLERLLQSRPSAVLQLLQTSVAQASLRKRLVRAYPDRLLDSLMVHLLPASSVSGEGVGMAWLPLLKTLPMTGSNKAFRELWWEALLGLALDSVNVLVFDINGFYRAVLVRLAQGLGRSYPSVLTQLRDALNGKALNTPAWIVRVVKDLLQQQATQKGNGTIAGDRPSANLDDALSGELRQMLAHIERGGSVDSGFWTRLNHAIESLPADRKGQFMPVFQAAEAGQQQDKEAKSDTRRVLQALLHQALGNASATAEGKDTASQSPFSDTDTIYIGNAGLVVLWPFLQNFFNYRGLIEDKRFKDEVSAHRAAGLLQFLASGDGEIHEAQLPLNKILCGLDPEEVFDFGPEITQEEEQECHQLLQAAIHQAPILREMSIAGFRHSFLLRQGQVSAQDEHWLLRVERETHDIVLDRFPWGVGIVKLPWMDGMLQVEW